MIMTKEEFQKRWDSDKSGGGITFDDIADCAMAWGISSCPRMRQIDSIVALVTRAANCKT